MKVNWDATFKKIEKVIFDWQKGVSRAIILNTLAMSKLTHFGSVIPINLSCYDDSQAI